MRFIAFNTNEDEHPYFVQNADEKNVEYTLTESALDEKTAVE